MSNKKDVSIESDGQELKESVLEEMDDDSSDDEEEVEDSDDEALEEMEQGDGNTGDDGIAVGDSKTEKQNVYIPGFSRPLKKGEELVVDESAYKILHIFEQAHPCMSVDVLRDELGDNREEPPVTCTFVAGTQAERPRDNQVVVMRLSNLQTVSDDGDEEEDQDSDMDDDEPGQSDALPGDGSSKKPRLHVAKYRHHGGINRVRVARIGMANVCATWNDQSKVHIWSLTGALRTLDSMAGSAKDGVEDLSKEKPLFTFAGHQIEGFAMDWSSLTPGRLLSGDSRKNIHLWQMTEASSWKVDQRPFNKHKSSVEDVQWSPTEADVFASCSSDKSIKLWDTRVNPSEACIASVDKAHDADVNVLSWNLKDPFLLSGGDEGMLKVWDLRIIKSGTSVARFKHHNAPISSVHWSPHDATVFAAAAEDDQLTVWDLSVENDPEEQEQAGDSTKLPVPPQLLFIHQGQNEIKELRWFPQLPGLMVSTALSGFNVFRTISI